MAEVTWDEVKLKAVFKAAFLEVLEERRDLLRDVVEESIEDLAMGHAIEAGLRTPDVARDEISAIIEGRH